MPSVLKFPLPETDARLFLDIISLMVSRKSNREVGRSNCVFGTIIFGHLNIPGILIPPSKGSIALPPINFKKNYLKTMFLRKNKNFTKKYLYSTKL